jgi:TolB-like protein
MSMKEQTDFPTSKDAIDRYLASDAGDDDAGAITQAPYAPSDADDRVFARCDAVMALAPKVAESPDVAWAFDEARRLARSAPQAPVSPTARRWYANPGLAWGTACIFALALVVSLIPDATMEQAPAAVEPVVANVTFAPIVISAAWAQSLAEVDPVVTLANGDSVDSRSLAVLPFAGIPSESDISSASIDLLYQQVLRQLATIPSLYLIDAGTAAIYSDSGLPPEEIALQLGVRGIVEGRVDSVDGDVRFELRFTDASADGASIDQAIERPSAELAMLQTDIASSVLGALTGMDSAVQPNETF